MSVVTVVYQAYGRDEFRRDVLFSLRTLLAHQPDSSGLKFLVYTDVPDDFAGLPVDTLLLAPSTIALWNGPCNFFHRLKIEMIMDAMIRTRGDILYLDGDTFWTDSAGRLLSELAAGRFIFHVREGELSEKFHPWLHRFLRERAPSLELAKAVAPDMAMYNAGLLGIPYSLRRLLPDVLRLTDELTQHCYQRDWVEQLAFSHFALQNGLPATAETSVCHYWHNKYHARYFVDHWLKQSRVPPLRADDSRRFAVPNNGKEGWLEKKIRTLKRSWRKRVNYLQARKLSRSGAFAGRAHVQRLRALEDKLLSG